MWIHNVRGPKRFCPLQLARIHIHADDRRRSRQLAAHDDRITDSAAPDYGDRLTWLDLRRVERRTHASGNAAANQAQRLGLQRGIDRNTLA
jgi:hypothetical protein